MSEQKHPATVELLDRLYQLETRVAELSAENTELRHRKVEADERIAKLMADLATLDLRTDA